MNFLRKLRFNEDGITTVELILVLVVLIAIVLIFDTITKGAGEISA